MTFVAQLVASARPVEDRLLAAIAELPPSDVRAGMEYAARGGKRLRGLLVIESARLHGLPTAQAIPAAAAIEAMHACSLVHDDLPAMDDDDMRRGRPTVHVKWNEATAILVGDGLQTLAFDILARPETAADPAVRVELIAALARAAGAAGMVLGQAMDLAAERSARSLTLDEITTLQAGKTGALIVWAAQAGARLGRADPGPLGRYAAALGLAFQIADDIIDVEGDPMKAGKRLRKDACAGKATFVSILGLEGARLRASELVAEAEAALGGYGARADILRQAARFVIARDN